MNEEKFRMLRERLLESLEEYREIGDQEIYQRIDELLLDDSMEHYMRLAERYALRKELFNSIRRLDILQELLEAEMDAALGYIRNQKSDRDIPNKRNGHSKKTLKSQFGEFQVGIPRDRNGGFEPRLIPKYQQDVSGIEERKRQVLGYPNTWCLQNKKILWKSVLFST